MTPLVFPGLMGTSHKWLLLIINIVIIIINYKLSNNILWTLFISMFFKFWVNITIMRCTEKLKNLKICTITSTLKLITFVHFWKLIIFSIQPNDKRLKIDQANGNLKITNVLASDEGTYACQADTIGQQAVVSSNAHLYVESEFLILSISCFWDVYSSLKGIIYLELARDHAIEIIIEVPYMRKQLNRFNHRCIDTSTETDRHI